MVSGEPDFTKRMKGMMDLWWIKSVLLKDPTIGNTLPISIENPAIAYDSGNDRFKVDVEAMSIGTIDANVTDRAARLLGIVYGSVDQLQQRATTKELIVQIQHQGAEKDPTDRSWTITENLNRSWNLGASDVPDLSDRSARLLGVTYGTQDILQQRATTKELLVQIQHQGAEKDPTQIRALTSSDVVTVADVTKTATEVQIDETYGASGNATIHAPTGSNKVRLKLISLELDSDVDLGFRWTTTGTIYYLRKTAGVIVTNFIGCNPEGGAGEDLELNASGACEVKGYCLLEEIA